MKKFSFIAMLIVLLFTGCYEANINVGDPYFNKYHYSDPAHHKLIHYQVIGVYQDNNITLSKIDNVLNELKNKFNNSHNKITRDKEYLSNDQIATICRRNVGTGLYGYYKNLYEKRQLMKLCINKEMDRKTTVYSGSTTSAQLSNNSKRFLKILKITFKKGYNNHIIKQYYTLKVKRYDNKFRIINIHPKLYLIATYSASLGHDANAFFALTQTINSTLKKYKLKTIEKKTKIDLDEFL
jgi:hypothetical protein